MNSLLSQEYDRLLERHGLARPVRKSTKETLSGLSGDSTGLLSMAKECLRWDRLRGSGPDKRELSGFDESLERVKHIVGPDTWRRIESRTYFGEFPTSDLNAVAIETPHGNLCLVNTGCSVLVATWAFAFAVFGRLMVREGSIKRLRANTEFHVLLQIIYTILYAANHAQGGESLTRLISKQFAANGMSVVNVGRHIYGAMETFIVSHELGHIEGGRVRGATLRQLAAPAGALQVIANSHQEEYDADAYANRVLCALGRGHRSEPPLAMAFGGPCLMGLLDLVQIFEAKTNGRSGSHSEDDLSHPPPMARLERLVSQVHGLHEPDPRGRPGVVIELVYHDFVTQLRELREVIYATDIRIDGSRVIVTT